jgi:histidyl-tRNA synthetase
MPTNPAYTSHFKLFSLVTAGRDTGSFSLELSALREQIDCYLNLLKNLQSCGLSFAFKDIVVEISDTRIVAQLCQAFNIDRAEIRALVRARDSESSARILQEYERVWPKEVNQAEELGCDLPKHLQIQLNLLVQNVIANLAAAHTYVEFKLNLHRLTGLGYYEGPCFHLKLKNHQDMSFMLADGGFVNWTQRMLADNKERLLTSAIGTELICRMFAVNQGKG